MKIIDRYIVVEFLKYFVLALLVLTTVFFISEYLRGVWDADVSPLVVLRYSAYLIPHTMCQMVPPAAMLGTAVSLSLMNRKNELTAIQASGIGVVHISVLILVSVFVACCLTLVVYDRIVPPMAKKRTAYYWKAIKGRNDFTLDIKTSKIWYRSKNYIYNLRYYDQQSATIQGIGIYFFNNNFHLVQHVEANQATYNSDKQEWLLKNGMLTVFSGDDEFPNSKPFQEKRFQLPETPSDFLEIEKQVDTLRLKDLAKFIARNKEAGVSTRQYEVDLHSRVAVSFIALIMALIAIPASIRPKRQAGLGKDIAAAAGWIFVYWLMFSLSVSLGRSGAVLPVFAVWAPSVFFLGVALVIVYRAQGSRA